MPDPSKQGRCSPPFPPRAQLGGGRARLEHGMGRTGSEPVPRVSGEVGEDCIPRWNGGQATPSGRGEA